MGPFKRAKGQSEATIGQEMTTLKGEGSCDSVKDDLVDVRCRCRHRPDLTEALNVVKVQKKIADSRSDYWTMNHALKYPENLSVLRNSKERTIYH